ncbi:MAG: hypothetical protein C0469_07710 [Cyanobacteria bacterium DS2.3.42]|nr:hypothetical protein [Cyanobacteria bacterium DS2.3.42]
MLNFPTQSVTAAHMFNRTAVLGSAAPADTNHAAALARSHGVVGKDGKVNFAVDTGALNISVYVYMRVAQKWLLRDGAVAAAANTIYAVDAPVGCPFLLVASAGTPTAWFYDEKHIGENNA